jgi:subtilisin family serine protease
MHLRWWQTATLLIAALTAHSATAGTEVGTFFSQGKRKQLLIENDWRVVSLGEAGSQKNVPSELAKAVAAMGLGLVPATAKLAHGTDAGVPVWFSKSRGALGILTSEIVLRTDSADLIGSLKKTREFSAVRESKVKNGLFVISFKDPSSALAWANKLSGQRGVKYAHPNFRIPKSWRNAVPAAALSGARKVALTDPSEEPYFTTQWHLSNTGQGGGTPGADIHVKEAWQVTLGSEDVIVGVLDAGFEVSHPDIQAGWYVNHGEIPGNSIDDDNNGYVDDVNGWNFRTASGDITDGYVSDHGTAVAGLVGARVNGRGMTGVCPRCSMLPVSLSWEVAEDAEAFYYAKLFGADIITNSWGYPVGTPYTDAVVEAINEVAATGRDGKGTIILFAMNNINQDDCVGDEPDISSLDSVIAVSAASDLDKKVSFSAWGACMEFLSPSYESGRRGIGSTDLLGDKGYNTGTRPGDLPDIDYTNDFGGTSAATPIAAGVFGLMLSVNENLTRDEALAMVLATADKVHPDLAGYDPSGFSLKYGFGRINAAKALRAVEVFRKYSSKGKTGSALQ